MGALLNEDDEILVFYKDSKDNWFRDTFSNKGVFKETTSYSLTDLLVDELKYSTDLNADGEIGDVIKSFTVRTVLILYTNLLRMHF